MELKVEFQDSDAAERVAKRPGVKRIDGRTVLGCGENILELLALIPVLTQANEASVFNPLDIP